VYHPGITFQKRAGTVVARKRLGTAIGNFARAQNDSGTRIPSEVGWCPKGIVPAAWKATAGLSGGGDTKRSRQLRERIRAKQGALEGIF
jgi:hypothetical protein